MKFDFTYLIFKDLLIGAKANGYNIIGFEKYISNNLSTSKSLILRHDVDRFPNHALKMAQIEHSDGIGSTYFFRIIPSVFKSDIIRSIASLGHEIGYHYEELATYHGDYEKAIDNFEKNLRKLRDYYPVKTICMHGSPLSKWDNKLLWTKYNYNAFGIVADTSLDVDYDEVFYISDNGHGWNRTNTSIRDKVTTRYNISIKSTTNIIELLKQKGLPDKLMVNAHPDTFFDPGIKWALNYGFIESKNLIKRLILIYNNNN
jgi:hypothetical protein